MNFFNKKDTFEFTQPIIEITQICGVHHGVQHGYAPEYNIKSIEYQSTEHYIVPELRLFQLNEAYPLAVLSKSA